MSASDHVSSYYTATAISSPQYARLESTVTADICVVGGGFTGVSAALHLAERGYDVILLEAVRIGWGASGRSGGQIATAFATDMANLRAWVGPDDARRLFELSEEAKAIIAARVARHEILCDLVWSHFDAANKPRHLDELKAVQAEWAEIYGYTQTSIAERSDLPAHIDSNAYVGGLHDPGGGHLHPLNYCLGLAGAARDAGVRIFENSPVIRLQTNSQRPSVETPQGDVTANYILMCTNAYIDNLVPRLRQKIMPVGTYIGATPPLGQNRAASLLPTNAAVTDCNFVLDYYRRSADHRLLYGGRVSYSTVMPPNLPHVMRRRMLHVFPQLADQHFEYTWGGYVAITVERTPHLGRLGRHVFFAQGFSGQGVALTGLAGKLMSEVISGDAERFDIMAKLPHTTFPGGRVLRTPILTLAMLWYRIRDHLP